MTAIYDVLFQRLTIQQNDTIINNIYMYKRDKGTEYLYRVISSLLPLFINNNFIFLYQY